MIKNYETTIGNLNGVVKLLESNFVEMENELCRSFREIDDLKAQLEVYTKSEVALKDVEQEVFKVKTVTEKTTAEEGKKRRLEHNKEVDEVIALRDEPPSKILKIIPAPRIIPPPGTPKPEAVTSPKSSPLKKKFLKRDRSRSPQPSVPTICPPTNTLAPIVPPTSTNNPIVVSAQRKKRKKDKEKKKT